MIFITYVLSFYKLAIFIKSSFQVFLIYILNSIIEGWELR